MNLEIHAASKDDAIQVLEMDSGRLLSSLADKSGKLQARTKKIAFSPDGKRLVTAGIDGNIHIYEFNL